MTEAFFSGWDIAGAADDPGALPDGTHEVSISKVEVVKSKKENYGLVITFTGDGAKSVRDWNSIPDPASNPANWGDDEHRNMSYLKSKYRKLGIPESRMNQVGPNDLIGIDAVITVSTDGNGYKNVNRIQVDGSVSADPFQAKRLSDEEIVAAKSSLPPEEDDDDLLAGL